jgi:hypothetical protein
MGDDNPVEGTLPLSQQFAIQRDHWLRKFGFEVYRDYCMNCYLWGRWRFLWYNPRFRENWTIEAIFNEGVWQIGIGPAAIVYVRSDDF